MALVGTFNQEKAVVGAFSVIVKSSRPEPSFNHRTSDSDTPDTAGSGLMGLDNDTVGAV